LINIKLIFLKKMKYLLLISYLFVLCCDNDSNPLAPLIEGCIDELACNFDNNATIDDGSCVYAEEFYDCNGNCLVDANCLDECEEDYSNCTECESNPLIWQINPPDFEYNGSVTAAVIINNVQVGSENDFLAGFVNDEIRGVTNGLFFPVTENYTFNIMLFSNLISGETISFKYYHAASGQVFCLSETINFESDMIIANAITPFIFNLDFEFND
tara:strand:- start:559 stop:1200 length:642 start_codon:yes stop_codon:yes gene_type:complete